MVKRLSVSRSLRRRRGLHGGSGDLDTRMARCYARVPESEDFGVGARVSTALAQAMLDCNLYKVRRAQNKRLSCCSVTRLMLLQLILHVEQTQWSSAEQVAVRCCDAALYVSPQCSEAHLTRAWANYRLGDLEVCTFR